ncbi:MAG: hypothetical protein COA97_05255 [Flavobacteriales bacterium]|nr:MAG: hypothetical protein COA97_05255 [Flavobacteriales bacterium]
MRYIVYVLGFLLMAFSINTNGQNSGIKSKSIISVTKSPNSINNKKASNSNNGNKLVTMAGNPHPQGKIVYNRLDNLIPKAYRSHPEYGKVKLEGSPESIELLQMREPYSRTFQNPDGSFSKQQTAGFFHYTDEEGRFVSIDKKLKQDIENKDIYVIKQTGLPIQVDASTGIIEMILEQGKSMIFGKEIEMSVMDADGNVLSVNEAGTQGNSYSKNDNTIVINNVFPNINRVHKVTYDRVETDFILNSIPALPISEGNLLFTEKYTLPAGWSIVETSEGELNILNASGIEVGKLHIPIYYDSSIPDQSPISNTSLPVSDEEIQNNNKSDNIITGSYQWKKIKSENNAYTISVIVPIDWLLSDNRVYPVTIDPVVSNTYAAGNIGSCFNPTIGSQVMNVTTCANSTVTATASTWQYAAVNGQWRSEVYTRIGGIFATYQWYQCAINSGGLCNVTTAAAQDDIANGFYATGIVPITIGITRVWGGAGCNTTYSYIVNNSWTETVTYTSPAPGAPTTTAATGITSTQFTANWTAVGGAANYFLDVATDVGFTAFVPGYNNLNVGLVTSTTVTPLTCNTTYYYRVRDENGCAALSANSNTTIAVTSPTPCPVTYLHPTSGYANEYVGSCEVATSTGTYTDDGGPAGNYSNNIGNDLCPPFWCPAGIYRVFCPDAVGNCITATFTSFDTEAGIDILRVTNGSTQNSPLLWSGSGVGIPGPFTGTINGCLGFRFASDFSVTRPGWSATISMAPCAGGPNGTDNNDCVNATLICNNIAVPGNSTGPGIVAEACGGAAGCPAGGENYSNWYSVSFTTSGTFNFNLVPSVGTDDYDYAIYGPAVTCTALGSPIRCSDAALTGNTGLLAGSGDLTEDVNGNKFTEELNVLAGETYYIMIDEWTPTGAGYNLNLGGTATISCVPLPVKLISFDAEYNFDEKVVNLQWNTATEINNDYFLVERSLDGVTFEQIGKVKGSGNSTQQQFYWFEDANPNPGEINYYRLKQVDFDGKYEYSYIVAVVIDDPLLQFSVYPNPATESTNVLFHTVIATEFHLAVYDYTGKLIISNDFIATKGKNIIPLDLKGYSQGIYFMSLQGNGNVLKKPFIKK